MRKTIYFAIVAVVPLLLILTACGARKGIGSSPTGTAVSASQATEADSSESRLQIFTEEDLRIMAMSYDDRLEYLQRKYRGLVFELHGIVIDEDVGSSKATRSLDEEHVVEGDNNNPPPPPTEWHEHESVVEYINLQRDGDSWQWTLTFLERLYADYDFNGTVAIADITPLAVHFGHTWHPGWGENGEWDDDTDPHLDRLSGHDFLISIADVSPIAQNFGMQTRGYNVYCFAQSETLEDSQLLAKWRRDIGNRQSQRKQPA